MTKYADPREQAAFFEDLLRAQRCRCEGGQRELCNPPCFELLEPPTVSEYFWVGVGWAVIITSAISAVVFLSLLFGR